jgi:hypothetical protein
MATKRFRQNAILALVRNRQIDSQQQLAKELAFILSDRPVDGVKPTRAFASY